MEQTRGVHKTKNAHLMIKPQIIECKASQITLQFAVLPDGQPRLWIFSRQFPEGHRELQFDTDGNFTGVTTYKGCCQPSWFVAKLPVRNHS
jgi:hypothetical protein